MELVMVVIRVSSIATARGPDQLDEWIVPLDGTTASERALPIASSLASATGSGLRLLTTQTEIDGSTATSYLENIAASLPTEVDADVDADQQPADAVAAAADSARTGVCMTTHARGRLLAALHPNIAAEVVTRAAGPVVLVGPACRAEPLGEGPILLAHDGSPEATAAGHHVLDLAALLHRAVEVVAVVSAPSGRPSDEPYPEESREMGALCDHAARLGVAANHRLVFASEVHDGLMDAIEQVQPALVAMMTHHRDRLELFREGSLTMDVVHHAPVPVLVARR